MAAGARGESDMITLDVGEIDDILLKDTFNFTLFHLADTWKDAIVKPSVNMPNELFSRCMKVLYGKDAMTQHYKGGLDKIKIHAKGLKDAKVFPVDRLNPIESFFDPSKKKSIHIPSNIKYVIRDWAGLSKSYATTLKVLGIVSDYTDPANREQTSKLADSRVFPEKGDPLFIDDSVFERLLGKPIIQNFVAVIEADNTCKVSFDINDIVRGGVKSYEAEIQEEAYRAVNDDAEFMTGNYTKNNWFNNNKDKITNDTIQEGIARLVCKEIFGDTLIGLVALKFKNHIKKHPGEYDGDAGVFTADGSLAALCIHLHLNLVTKSILNDHTAVCEAYIFTDDPESILQEEKEVEINRIIDNNKKHSKDIQNVIHSIKLPDTEIEVKDIGNGNLSEEEKLRLIPFLEYFVELIEGINKNIVPHYQEGYLPGDTFVEFKQAASEYNIRNIINYIDSSPGKYTIKFRSMHNPLPGWATEVYPYESEYDKMIFVNKDTIIMKLMYIILDIPYNAMTGGQRGGALMPSQTANQYFNLKEHDEQGDRTFISDEEENDPSSYLRKIIEEVLAKNPHRIPLAVKGAAVRYIDIDWTDIYELLYPIYQVSGTICYDPGFIVYAIQNYLTPKENPVSLISYYYENIIHRPLSLRKPPAPAGSPSTPLVRHSEGNIYYPVYPVKGVGKRKFPMMNSTGNNSNSNSNNNLRQPVKVSRPMTPQVKRTPYIATPEMAFGGRRKRKSKKKRKTQKLRRTRRN